MIVRLIQVGRIVKRQLKRFRQKMKKPDSFQDRGTNSMMNRRTDLFEANFYDDRCALWLWRRQL